MTHIWQKNAQNSPRKLRLTRCLPTAPNRLLRSNTCPSNHLKSKRLDSQWLVGPPLTKSKRQPHDQPTRSIMAELMPQCITNHKATLFPPSHNNKPAKADVGTQQIKQNTSCEQYFLILLSLYCWGACAWRAASRTDCKLRRPREVAFVKPFGREQLPSRTCWEMPPETKIHCENSAFMRVTVPSCGCQDRNACPSPAPMPCLSTRDVRVGITELTPTLNFWPQSA